MQLKKVPDRHDTACAVWSLGVRAGYSPSDGEEITIFITGSLDAFSVSTLSRCFAALVARSPRSVVLDLSQVPLMDAMGIRALVRLSKLLEDRQSRLTVIGLCRQPGPLCGLPRLDPTRVTQRSIDDARPAPPPRRAPQ